MLNALNTTHKLDALYKRGRTSAEFISAATPIEGIFVNLHKKLTRGDPRSDLFANTFEAYQQTAVAMVAKERGRAGHPDSKGHIFSGSYPFVRNTHVICASS